MATDELQDESITVIGAGAIGGTVGAYLHQAGYDVTLVDQVEEHVRAINQDGLRIEGFRGELLVHPPAVTPDQIEGELGVTLLCVKGHFTEDAMQMYAPRLSDDGYIVSLQNGLNEEIIARHVGRERTIGAFIHFGADYVEPGRITLASQETIHLGELDGSLTSRLAALQLMLSHVMPCELTTNIYGYLWGKLVYAGMAFVVSTVDATVPEIIDTQLGRRLARGASAEAYRVASQQVDQLEHIGSFDPNAFVPGPDFVERADAALDAVADPMRSGVKHHMGIWRDLRVKRRKTEVDMQIAAIVEHGHRLGIPTPVNAATLDVVHQIERGERGMGWENLDLIAECAGISEPDDASA